MSDVFNELFVNAFLFAILGGLALGVYTITKREGWSFGTMFTGMFFAVALSVAWVQEGGVDCRGAGEELRSSDAIRAARDRCREANDAREDERSAVALGLVLTAAVAGGVAGVRAHWRGQP